MMLAKSVIDHWHDYIERYQVHLISAISVNMHMTLSNRSAININIYVSAEVSNKIYHPVQES